MLVAKEISKIHETFIRADIDDLKLFKTSIKGELTVIISEKKIKNLIFDEQKIVNKVKKYIKKYSLKDTVDSILETESVKKDVYKICLKVKNEQNL